MNEVHRRAVPDRLPYACGLLLLGAVGFAFKDFALQWQPVPETLPQRQIFAGLSAGLLIACGIALLTSYRRIGAIVAAAYLASWVVLLHLPRVIAKPGDVSMWLGFAELTALALGGMSALLLDRQDHGSVLARRVVQYGFAAATAVFGVSHFVYAQFTATLVPAWLPAPLFWAYATGAGHLAASLSLFTGILTRLATALLACMLAIFVLTVHIPKVVETPTSHAEWTALGIATTMMGAAWLLARLIAASRD